MVLGPTAAAHAVMRKLSLKWLISGTSSPAVDRFLTSSVSQKHGGAPISGRQQAVINAVFAGGMAHVAEDLKDMLPLERFKQFAMEARAILKPIVDQGRKGASLAAMNLAMAQVIELFTAIPEAEELTGYLVEKSEGTVANSGMDHRQELFNCISTLCRVLTCLLHACPKSSIQEPVEGNKTGFVEIYVFFATNRKPSGRNDARAFFSTARGTEMTFGCAAVSVPDVLHLRSKLASTPACWNFQQHRAVGKRSNKVTVSKLITVSQAFAGRQIHRAAEKSGNSEALMFVHGYNTRFPEALKRLAAAAYSLAWSGPIMLFSWPSFESLQWYTGDEANAMWTVPQFQELVRFLTSPECGLTRVDFLAHSMGSRVLIYGLTRFDVKSQPPGAAKLGRIVLAAPDFDTWEFHLMAENFVKKVEHVTIYCASDDQALKMSTAIHGGYPRLGDFRWSTILDKKERPLLMCERIDIVDATGLDGSIFGPHHGYIFSQTIVLRDLFEHIKFGTRPGERADIQSRQTSSGRDYFVLVPSNRSGEEELLRLSSSGSDRSEQPSPRSELSEMEDTMSSQDTVSSQESEMWKELELGRNREAVGPEVVFA